MSTLLIHKCQSIDKNDKTLLVDRLVTLRPNKYLDLDQTELNT